MDIIGEIGCMADKAHRALGAACPGPDPSPHGPTRYAVPSGAIDTHAHVIGLPPEYPLVPNRVFTAPAAPASDYLRVLDATGMARGVLVQVSAHGTDNRLLFETLRANSRRLKGIGVMPLRLSDKAYREAVDAGVVGLRLNTLFGGGIGLDDLESYGALCKELGWHLQFLIDGQRLPELATRLARLQVPVVIDHMGHIPASKGVKDHGFRTLISLMRDGAWVKLSGAYRVTEEGPPYRDTIPLGRALAEAVPERCVWGSDWPHVAHWEHMMNVGDLLDLLADWVPDEATRRRVFVDNPAQLYGFPA
jgi:predicted TIM-barrel fold metal-dependent hydrolase